MFRFSFLFVGAVLALSACASNPGPGNLKTVPSNSGPVIEANVQRLYPNDRLYVCRNMTVSNKPSTDSKGEVRQYSKLIVVDGKVPLVTAPANNACISSGFGERWGKAHKGLDITSSPASRIFSAGAGTIVEAGMNGGYGLSVLIDHGHGVYTRYGHLNYKEPNIVVGARVVYGEPLGLMGKTGNVTGIHLHYEILTGKYQAGVWGRGLTARNPFEFPAWVDKRLAGLTS